MSRKNVFADPPVSPTRSHIMAAIKGKDTKPELLVRSLVHRAGLRFRKGPKHLPGKPDMVLAKYRAVVFVHGCFWHGHTCKHFRLPRTRVEYWSAKIKRNKERDREVSDALAQEGWRVFTIWECRLKDKPTGSAQVVVDRLIRLIRGRSKCGQIG